MVCHSPAMGMIHTWPPSLQPPSESRTWGSTPEERHTLTLADRDKVLKPPTFILLSVFKHTLKILYRPASSYFAFPLRLTWLSSINQPAGVYPETESDHSSSGGVHCWQQQDWVLLRRQNVLQSLLRECKWILINEPVNPGSGHLACSNATTEFTAEPTLKVNCGVVSSAPAIKTQTSQLL